MEHPTDVTAPPRIVVIDDDRGIIQALTLHLQFRGHQVASAETGTAGLELLKQGDVDLVLCDIGLPDISGHEVVKAAKRQADEAGQVRPEVVVMTANPTLDNAMSALREGAFQFVTKPLSMPFLEVVVERALATRALRTRVDRLQHDARALVLRSAAEVTGNPGLVGALEAVLRALSVLLKPATAGIWLHDQQQDGLRLTVGAPPGTEVSEEHRSAALACFEAGRPVADQTETAAYLAVPVLVGEVVEGAVTAEVAGSAGADYLEIVREIAGYAGQAVRKERLYADLEQSSMKISSLFEVGLAMSSEVSLQRLFDVIVDSAARICGADRCSLMLIDKDGETMRMRAARGIPPEVVEKAEARVGEGIAGSVAASGEPLFIANIEQDDRFHRTNAADRYNNRSLVCVPIRLHDRVVGVLNVNNKRDGSSFTPNDLNLVTLLASQAAVAIDNAHRYQDLSEKAITDGLTGVYIRRYFDEVLERAFRTSRATGRPFSLLMVDIDHFKRVNDAHGHLTGDQALRTVAGVLKGLVRDEDLVARYGGEEFAIILGRAGLAAGRRVAERVRATVENSLVRTEQVELKVTVSVGLATIDDHHGSAEALLQEADAALYRAKESGRNRVVAAADSQG
ncbi:MAG: diguanylate cyclase [Armatimonadetes bacterium]|nr:diguanylate cyclase [Armatimonadota bacterium]